MYTNKLLHQLFEDQAKAYPNKKAIISPAKTLTYRELSIISNKVAKKLLSLNAKPNTLIAIIMEKGWEEIVATLSILKAGAAYLPIDPNESSERLNQLLTQGDVKIILTQNKLKKMFKGTKNITLLCLDDITYFQNIDSSPINLIQKPTDLAYVMFTSGSTGIPKGVMIDHKGAINTILDINSRFSIGTKDKIYGISALNFDLSVYDIFGTFAAGATLVLPDYTFLKEPSKWLEKIITEKITIWDSVPTYFQILIEYISHQKNSIPKNQLSSLRLALLSGDWIPLTLPTQAKNIFNNLEVISLGGATEASIWSILFPIKNINPAWKSIPYGKPMTNQEFYIYDKFLNLVENGEIGELYIGGLGVAKGYWKDSKRTSEKFIIHPETGEYLYKTGDSGRYMSDGNIEFLGRIDYQVKISGYRIDISGIENHLSEHPLVKQVVVLPGKHRKRLSYLHAFIIAKHLSLESDHFLDHIKPLAQQQIDQWQKIYEEISTIDINHEHGPIFNTSGWISSYTGQLIPYDEMQEWIDCTVNRILSFKPKKVLEIGCGLGLLLFRIAPHCEKYIGTDFSSKALEYTKNHLKEIKNTHRISLNQCQANEFDGLFNLNFDTIILNSVIQYFPHIYYLNEVLEGCLKVIKPGGQIFIGDVRSLHHITKFHESVLIHKYPQLQKSKKSLMKLTKKYVDQDEELVIAPNFFSIFAKEHPHISHIEILLKRGIYHNEMNCFRYDVILHIEKPTRTISYDWMDYKEQKFTFDNIYKLLQRDPCTLAFKNIPNKRLTQLINDNKSQYAIDPEKIWELADKMNYKAYITWNDQNPQIYFDTIFHKQKDENYPIKFQLNKKSKFVNSKIKNWDDDYANFPLKIKYRKRLANELRNYLKLQFPSYMIPTSFSFIDTFPLTSNGKIDRKKLTKLLTDRIIDQHELPKTAIEKKITSIWQKVFGLSFIGIHDNFLTLGGDSLIAIQIIVQINKTFNINFTLQTFHQAGTIAKIAKKIELLLEQSNITI